MSDIDNSWISIHERLPEILKKAMVKTERPYSILSGYLKVKTDNCCSERVYFEFEDINGNIMNKITHWRYIEERKPDFSKLNEGDFIHIEYYKFKDIIFKEFGYLYKIVPDNALYITSLEGSLGLQIILENIKKITRIDIEKQTFEEI